MVQKTKMKKHYAITLSDAFGSKHFVVKTTIKRNLIIAGVAVVSLISALFATNSFQFYSVVSLTSIKRNLNEQLLQANNLISNLQQGTADNQQQMTNISKELVAMEQFSGVDTGDTEYSLEQRIKRVRRFYHAREAEYVEIGSKVEKIEAVIGEGISGDDGTGTRHVNQSELDLTSRVDLVGFTVNQERMLHDNIPNGYPVKNRIVTSAFGMRDHPVTKVKSFHNGVDLRARISTAIFAPANGFISNVDYSKLSGNRIVILHNFGFETRYSHLKKSQVSPGDMVRKGDLIGYSGNTGRSLAPHLHYEIRYLRRPINPRPFLTWEFGTHEIFTQVKGIKWHSLIKLINEQITRQTLQLSQLERTSQEK